MTFNQIIKFENQNNISVNVYSIEEKNSSSQKLRLAERGMYKHVNLLYMQDPQDAGHFALIKDLSRHEIANY